jgi:hypothetical protein
VHCPPLNQKLFSVSVSYFCDVNIWKFLTNYSVAHWIYAVQVITVDFLAFCNAF